MNKEEIEKYTNFYYQSGSPDRASEVLHYLISSEMLQIIMDRGLHTIPYFFSRIAQNHPKIIRQYEALFDKASHEGRLLILRILEFGGDEETRDFISSRINEREFKPERHELDRILRIDYTVNVNPLRNPICRSQDLDLLWTEFVLTGNTIAIRRIIQVLEWPDIVRKNFQTWLESEPWFRFLTWSKTRRSRMLVRLRDLAGIECDIEQNRILTVDDLDCICVLEDLQIIQGRFQKIRQALPFKLSANEINDILVKAMAKWSLGSNALQHPLVLETCEEELTNRIGRSKLALLEIVARTYLFHNDETSAAEKITEYIQLNPAGVKTFSKTHNTNL
jgi:hypothetical protein